MVNIFSLMRIFQPIAARGQVVVGPLDVLAGQVLPELA